MFYVVAFQIDYIDVFFGKFVLLFLLIPQALDEVAFVFELSCGYYFELQT